MQIRLATPEIQKDSIVDGEGIRSVIWTQGCLHHCPGCHNPSTHSFDGGYLVDVETVKKQIDNLEGQDGITFSGGDPMEQPIPCADIALYAKAHGLNVWCYTGYTFEELLEKAKKESDILNFLEQIDILVDGRFLLKEKSYDVVFRGSKNQRLIDVTKSLKKRKAVFITKYDLDDENSKKKKPLYV